MLAPHLKASRTHLKLSGAQELLRVYFYLGLDDKDIAVLLARRHGYVVSERNLKRI